MSVRFDQMSFDARTSASVVRGGVGNRGCIGKLVVLAGIAGCLASLSHAQEAPQHPALPARVQDLDADPYPVCRMFETPPNWTACQDTDPTFASTWVYDKNFKPMILVNIDVYATPAAFINEFLTVYQRYLTRVTQTNGAAVSTFKNDLAVVPLKFGHNDSVNNPTRFVRTSNVDVQNVIWTGSVLFRRPEHHIWLGDGIDKALLWVSGQGGLLDQFVTATSIPTNNLSALPTRFVLDVEIGPWPVLREVGGVYPTPVDRINQTRVYQAMMADPRWSSTNLDYRIPYKSTTGVSMAEHFNDGTAAFFPPIYPITADEEWLTSSLLPNFEDDADMSSGKNRQFQLQYAALWQKAIDGAIHYSFAAPLNARLEWNNTKMSNYAFANIDDASHVVATDNSMRPVRTNEARPLGGTPFEFGWHFDRFTSNDILPANFTPTRSAVLGKPQIRNLGAATVRQFVSSGVWEVASAGTNSLDFNANVFYTADVEAHRQPNLYHPPTGITGIGQMIRHSSTGIMSQSKAPLETEEETILRIFRMGLESEFYSKGGGPLKSTPWVSMPYINHDAFPPEVECGPTTNFGDFPSVSLDTVRRALMLFRGFGITEINVFGGNTGFCDPTPCPNQTRCTTNNNLYCYDGDYQHWADFQQVYYEAFNPYMYSCDITRGSLTTNEPVYSAAQKLKHNYLHNGQIKSLAIASDQEPTTGLQQTSMILKFGGLPVFDQPGVQPSYGTLRIVLESSPGYAAGLPITGQFRVKKRGNNLDRITLHVPDHDYSFLCEDQDNNPSTPCVNSPLVGRYGYWLPDAATDYNTPMARRVFDFVNVNPIDVLDETGSLTLQIIETNGYPNQSNIEFTSTYDMVQVCYIRHPLVQESMLAGGLGEIISADQNLDGNKSEDDIVQFLADFSNEHAAADVNLDGVIDANDAIDYMDAYLN